MAVKKLPKRKVLGRGLGALIGGAGTKRKATEQGTGQGEERFLLAPIEKVQPSANQPRKNFDKSALKELSDSITESGIIEPLVVRKVGSGFELIAGERRWRASRMAGLKEVPVVIMDVDDRKALELAIVENIQREDLNAIEEAEAYQNLIGFGLTQGEVAVKVGKDRATVANYLRLLKLADDIKGEIIKGTLSMGHARALLAVESHALQRELCRKVIQGGLSVRETERLVKASLNGEEKTKTSQPAKAKTHLNTIESDLRGVFGTKVSVLDKGGKGRVVIEFYSAEERERLIEQLRTVK
ncbi:MAG: ParB/RepB/Spo0J family partition protein [Deltaproteobacteria bacterium]|nr:ParB/RepB/Spo0J family partition protein [Deltaproteobacteria bacterium]